MKRLCLLIFACALLTGCAQDRPKATEGVKVIPLQVTSMDAEALEVTSQEVQSKLQLNHHIRNQDVYIECYIPNFTFKEKGGSKKNGEGHLAVYVDDRLVDEMNTAAFIVKNVPRGVHELTVEVFHNDSTSYKLKKSWTVTIK